MVSRGRAVRILCTRRIIAHLSILPSPRRARPIPGGDPRQNRAIAAKIVYPGLTVREALHLGGFSEDELNAVKDQKHTWRTGEFPCHIMNM